MYRLNHQKTLPLLLILAVSFVCSGVHAQDLTRVEDIRGAPNQYLNEVVTVEGYATQYVENPAQSSSFYYLKDDYGGILTVRTTEEPPEIGTRYRVTGPVGVDPRRNDPYISEESRVLVEEPNSPKDDEASNTPTPTGGGNGGGGNDAEAGNQTLIYLLVGAIGVVFLALIGLLVYVMRSRRQPAPQAAGAAGGTATAQPQEAASTPQTGTEEETASAPAGDGQAPEPEQVIEDETIKMHAPPQGTLKILPGRLVVKSGLDDINEVRFYKPKDQVESEITFGRADGEPYKHIQLKPRTVSSKQAKMVFNEDSEQYTLINYASEESNPTRVNGKELGVNEGARVEDGDQIRMGEVVFEYKAN